MGMVMDDRFAGIREFVAAVDSGSLTAAAAVLDVTGSAVGKSISRLEGRLGIQLLHRTTRRIDLTAEGEAYLVSCRRILEELDEAEAYLATGHHQPIGRLRIDMPTTFGRRHILPTLLALGAQYEALDLSLTFRDRTVDMVSEGIDLAVRIGELGDYPDLVARRLGEQRLLVCGSPAYLQRRGTPAKRADLAHHDCLIGWYRGNRPSWMLQNEQGQIEQYEVSSRHELTDGDALLHACMAGCGLAQLPGWLAYEAISTGALMPVLSEISSGTMPIHVVWQ
jgi:DNA-binding transcriptional LysR family regulator